MPRSLLSFALLAAAVVADANGARTLASYLVLAAIPVLAVAALAYFGDLVEGSADDEAGAVYVGLTSLALVLLVVGAAVRANALQGEAVPALGVTSVVGALTLLTLQLTVWGSLRITRERLVNALRSGTSSV